MDVMTSEESRVREATVAKAMGSGVGVVVGGGEVLLVIVAFGRWVIDVWMVAFGRWVVNV
jgi:hypothetical protein